MVALCLCVNISVRAAGPVTQSIFVSGNSAHRLNMTIVAEGYRASEQEQFFQDATNLVTSFFAAEPFAEYKNYFNAQAVFIASNESGSDHPAYPAIRDTYFNSSYDIADRLITVPSGGGGMGKVTALIKATFPETDLTVLLVNDLVYGGSGGPLLVVSKSASSPEILIHESGHTLAGLGDEYSDPSTYVPPTEPPNTTRQTDRNRIKWNAWISPNTPVPTPASTEFQSTIGLFEGAQNQVTGWYRPKLDCGMRTPGTPFCEVCREALVKAIYGKVRPAETFTPSTLSQVLRSLDPLSFQVNPLQPASNPLTVQWFLNGVAIDAATNEVLDLDPASLPKGLHLVRAELRDATTWVRNDPEKFLQQSITWRVEKRFPETTKPVVAISSPANGAKLTQPNVLITGTARDNIAVTQVLCQIGEGPFVPASGTTAWTFSADLPPGKTLFRVKSVDLSGNESLLKSRLFHYIVMSPLHLSLTGNGTVSGAANGQELEVGRSYRITARPAAGQLFLGWSGSITSNLPSLTFIMQSNLQLHATFVPNPFLLLQGNYVGLFRDEDAVKPESSGMVQLKIRGTGAFSGKLSMIDRDYRFSGKFAADKQTAILVKRAGKTPLSLQMVLSEEGQQVTGMLSATEWQASLRAKRAQQVDASWIGQRLTIALPGLVNETVSLGDSIGAVAIGRKDLRTMGTLADGARFSQTMPWVNDDAPFFWRARGKSMALGWVERGVIDAFPFSGEVDFLKPFSAASEPNSLTNRSAMVSSRFQRPASSSDPVLNFTRGKLLFEGGNLAEPFRADVSLETRNILKISGADASLRLTLGTGLIKGTFRHPQSLIKAPVYGVLLQNQTNIAGLFLGTNQTGQISFEIAE